MSTFTSCTSSSEYFSPIHHDVRDDLWRDVTNLVFKRMKEVQIYQPHFEEASKIANFSHNQYRPPNYGHGNFNGPHIDTGSYVFYIHMQEREAPIGGLWTWVSQEFRSICWMLVKYVWAHFSTV